ncbi:AP-4 complex subunit mu [Ancistrocladus abbreviatus]
MDRTLSLIPPDGEFPVMNYRMTQEFKPPFCINALIEAAGPLRAEFIIKVHTEFPSNITVNTIVVQMPLPTFTTRVSLNLAQLDKQLISRKQTRDLNGVSKRKFYKGSWSH